MRPKQRDGGGAGFSLVELLLVAALGVGLCGVAFQLLLGEARQGGALAERLILRRLQRRTLQLIKGDLADAKRWQLQPDPQPDWPCPMAHRDVLIAIHPAHGSAPVLYSLGSAPSGIWRGQVLMRCGPAFDLQGRSRASSTYQNRVVLDAIGTIKLHQPLGLPVIEMELEQLLNRGSSNNNRPKPVRSTAVG
jgi:type II secretory pathway pseudopilin PulG